MTAVIAAVIAATGAVIAVTGTCPGATEPALTDVNLVNYRETSYFLP